MALRFSKRLIDRVTYEAASVFDVDNDGILDIVSGEYWYKGPDFNAKYKICHVKPEGDYYDDFCDYPLDVNGDGRKDIVTGGWFEKTLRWRENPGNYGEWIVHDIDICGNIETIRFYDIDNCGTVEIFPNTPNDPQVFYKIAFKRHGVPSFLKYTIGDQPSGHGMGFGDINADGRTDIILAKGWLEQPKDPFHGTWQFHSEYDLGASASVPIVAHDVSGNGKLDLIVGQGHDYGLSWWEQEIGPKGNRLWKEHKIDPGSSQYHDMWLVDLDNDGKVELVTGKRYRAHGDKDPGSADPLGLYYFKIESGQFKKNIIDFGAPGDCSGCGLYFWIEDIDGDGRLDIVAPGKDGLFLFLNRGEE